MSKRVVITGTSSGLGLELALMLVEHGHKVVATMRNLEKQGALTDELKARGLDQGALFVKQLDVQDAQSVSACIEEVEQELGGIDVLVNNAGAGFVRTTEQATEEEISWQLDVNLMGVIRCTKAVLPSMRVARSGHIINVTSVGGLVGQPFNEIYCATKFGVEGYTESLASYIQPSFGIKFTLVEPGGIASEFANSVLKQFAQTGGMRDDEYRPILENYIEGAQSRMGEGSYQTSQEVAAVVKGCILMEDPPLRIRTSPWAEAFCHLKTGLDPTGNLLSQEIRAKTLGIT